MDYKEILKYLINRYYFTISLNILLQYPIYLLQYPILQSQHPHPLALASVHLPKHLKHVLQHPIYLLQLQFTYYINFIAQHSRRTT